MRRLTLLLLIASLATVGACKKKGKVDNNAETDSQTEDTNTEFVKIDLGEENEELQDLIGSELMQATAQCGDLQKMEPAAMMGKLTDGEIRCLDKTLHEADRQTVKDKVSRVLMADAWAKGDMHRWEAVVRRHLETIDRSDPDLCYSFAKYLSKLTPDYADETMKWADVALDNRAYWTGDTHVARVNALYKLKAVSASRKWTFLEEDYLKTPTAELLDDKNESRNQAKTLAREWLEYAKSSGKDYTVALQMCVSAAGTSDFCEATTTDDGGQADNQ